jgi:glycosyltransferase involved in cell wall biosynthesis
MKPCIVIPHFDHLTQFMPLLPQLAATGLPVFVVDDGSPAQQVAELRRALALQLPDARLLEHAANCGKGAAVTTGLLVAGEQGFTHAVQVDADGQHDIEKIPQLLREAAAHPGSIISGLPSFDKDIPGIRYYLRYHTPASVWLETLSPDNRDSMCGFRVYPLQPVLALLSGARLGSRMNVDTEILVRASWRGIGFRHIPVSVSYPPDGRSHFRYFRDNVLISWMHARLITGMVLRLPWLLARRLGDSA